MRFVLFHFIAFLSIGALSFAEHTDFKPSTTPRPVIAKDLDPEIKAMISTEFEKFLQKSRPEWRPTLAEFRRAISGLFPDREQESKNQAIALLASLSSEELQGFLALSKMKTDLSETAKMISDAIAANDLNSETLVGKLDAEEATPAEEAEFLSRMKDRGIEALSKAIGIRPSNLLKLSDDILKNDADSSYVANNVVAFQRTNEDFSALLKLAQQQVDEKTRKLNEGIRFYQPWRNDSKVQKTLQGYRDEIAVAKQKLVNLNQERTQQLSKSAGHLKNLKASLDSLALSELSAEGTAIANRLRLATNTQLTSLTGEDFDSPNPEGKWGSSQAFNEGSTQAASVKQLVDGYLTQLSSPLTNEAEKEEALQQLRRIYGGAGSTKGLDRFALALERAKAAPKTSDGKLDPNSTEYQDVVRWVSILSENGKMPFSLDSTNSSSDRLARLGLDPTTVGRINFTDTPWFGSNMQKLVKHLPAEALKQVRLASSEAFNEALPQKKEMRAVSKAFRTYNVTATTKDPLKSDMVDSILEPVADAIKEVAQSYQSEIQWAMIQSNPETKNALLLASFERLQADFKDLVPMIPWEQLKPILRTALIAAASTPGKTDLALDFLQNSKLNPKAKEHIVNISNAVSQLEEVAAKKFVASLKEDETTALAATSPNTKPEIRLNSAEIPQVAPPTTRAAKPAPTYQRPQRFWRSRFR